MISHFDVHLALRNRALATVVATTGSTTLSGTATGYARASGSFVTDGFANGMELAAAGFGVAANNGAHVITNVSALAIVCSGCVVEAAASGRTLSVGLPAVRAFENVVLDPDPSRPYLEEDFVPATASLVTFPAQGGDVEETGLYVVKIFGLQGVGIAALRKTVDALRARFTPGTTIAAGANTVRVRGDTSTQTGQILPLDGGWAVLTLTIPWRARSTNTIAA